MNPCIFGSIKALDDSGAFDSIITELLVDRDGEVVMPAGIDNREEYLANPIVFWGHEGLMDPAAEPIARATRLDVYPERIESSALFAPTPKAQNVRVLVRGKFVSTISMGYKEREVRIVNGIPTVTKWSLWEYSVLALPANTGAVITGVKSALSWLAETMPDEITQDDAHLTAGRAWVDGLVKGLEDAHLTLSETPGGVAVVDRKRVIARIARRRVLTI